MKTIIILGQARTGTSMLTGLLEILGVHIDKVHNPSPQNPKGAFENETMISITRNLMNNFKINEQIKLFKNYCLSKPDLWGFKSAVTHFGIQHLLPHIKNPHFVVIFRNPLKAAESWKIHMKDVYGTEVTLQHALEKTMESYNMLIKALNNKIPRFMTTYEILKSDKNTEEAKKLAKFIEIPYTSKKENEIKQFILNKYTTLEA